MFPHSLPLFLCSTIIFSPQWFSKEIGACEAQRRWQRSPENPWRLMKKPFLYTIIFKQCLLIDLGSWKIIRILCNSIFGKKDLEVIGLHDEVPHLRLLQTRFCPLKIVNFRDKSTTHRSWILLVESEICGSDGVSIGYRDWFSDSFWSSRVCAICKAGCLKQNPIWLDASHRWWASLSPPRCC